MQIYPPGTMIGQYEIASHPMMGGMGVVYFAVDHGNDGRPVALKTFRAEFLPDRAARDRFLREGTAWVELGRHPHIVRCHEVKYYDPTAFLVLELIAREQSRENASLRAWLGAPMPVEQALLFALQIACGMKHATDKIPGFVHRDVKPENVLVGADKLPGTAINRLRVTDFGLAVILKDETGRIKDEENPDAVGHKHLTHGIVGTPLYMAPEQWKGEALGIYTDIYALGCILFEMLRGQRAAVGRTLSELQAVHCAGNLRSLPTEWPRAVRELLTMSLALRPQARPQSWDEIIHALEQAYAAQGLGSAPQLAPLQAESREERKQAGWSYNALGLSYKDMGKAEVAVGYFERAIGIARETGDRYNEGATLGNLGSAYLNLGNTRLAIGYFEQCLELHREIGDRRGVGADLVSLGIAYASLGNARRAIGYYEQGLELIREAGDRHGEGSTLGNIGNAYADLNDVQRSIEYHEQYLAIAREIGYRRGEGNALGGLGIAYATLSEMMRANEYFEQYLVIAREIGDRSGERNALGNLGNVHKNLGDTRCALGYFEQALEISREIGDRRGERNILGNLGDMYAKLDDARRAIGYYEESLIIDREISDRRREGNDLENLGIAYKNLGDAQHALGYFEQAVVIARELGDRHREGNTLGNLGVAYKHLGNAQCAIGYYEQAVLLHREIGDLDGVASVSFNLALLYAEHGEPTRALPLAQEALLIWTKLSNSNYQHAQQLITQLQGGRTPIPTSVNLSQTIVDAFQQAGSPQAMQAAVAQHPMLNGKQFIQAIEEIIQEQVPQEHKPAFEQRLTWLKQIAGK